MRHKGSRSRAQADSSWRSVHIQRFFAQLGKGHGFKCNPDAVSTDRCQGILKTPEIHPSPEHRSCACPHPSRRYCSSRRGKPGYRDRVCDRKVLQAASFKGISDLSQRDWRQRRARIGCASYHGQLCDAQTKEVTFWLARRPHYHGRGGRLP